MNILRFTKGFILKYKRYLLIYIFLSLISRAISIVFPFLTGVYIDLLITTDNNQVVTYVTLFILVTGIFSISSSFIQKYLYVKIQTKSMTDLNFHIVNHLVKVPIRYFEKKDSSYLNQRIYNDSNVVISFFLDNFINIISNALNIIILLYISFIINIKLTLTLLPMLPLYLLLYCLFGKLLYHRNYRLKEDQNKFFSKMNQYIQNINLIKVNSTFEESNKTLEDSFDLMLKSLLKHTKLSLLFSNSNTLTMVVANGIIFLFGGREVIRGNLSVGEFTIINSYFTMIMANVSYFLNFGNMYQKALVSQHRILEILNEPTEINGSIQLEQIDSIRMDNVSFTYDNYKNIVNSFYYEFKKGEIYCITGSNGTGKSTLIKLLLGLYNDYYSGEIYYNSIELKKIDMYKTRRNMIGVTQQEPKLINSKLKENMTYGLNKYNNDDLEFLYSKLNIATTKFTNGIETMIDEASSNISGGEKLKVSLVRTFLKNPNVIILDEPTSALDTLSIESLKELLVLNKENKIIIIITHDHQFEGIADKVIQLN